MKYLKYLLIGMVLTFAGGCGPAVPTLAGGQSVNHWMGLLHDADPKRREEAVEKLGNVGSADPAAYPALTGALKDSDARVRGAAILGIVKGGAAAKAAAPTLEDLKAHDPDGGVRDYAARALKAIQGGG